MNTKSIRRSVAALLLLSTLNFQLSTLAQVPTLLHYQGRAITSGTNFEGPGLFKFALVDGGTPARQATATASLFFDMLAPITVTDQGAGYTVSPAVSFSGGGGFGAAAHAVLSSGRVVGIAIDTPGSGYSSPPQVMIAAPPPGTSFLTIWSNDGTSVGGSEPTAAVSLPVTKGLYATLLGDTNLPNMTAVPASVFANSDVRLRVWFNDGSHGFQQLTPDQRIASVGYAMMAASVQNGAVGAASVQNGSLTAAKLASGQVVKSLNSLKDDITLLPGNNVSITPSGNNLTIGTTAWGLNGNSGTGPTNFVGTTDAQPLELRVNSGRALRLERFGGSVNVIAGAANNSITSQGSTIGGGDYNSIAASVSFIGGGDGNNIGGSSGNSFLGGGTGNSIEGSSPYSFLGGGFGNRIQSSASDSFLGGGAGNVIWNYAVGAVLAGGRGNTIKSNATHATISGGESNLASGNHSTVSGGLSNRASVVGVFIGGGAGNTGSGGYAAIVGGANNQAVGAGGGNRTALTAWNSAVGGGLSNNVGSPYTTIGGGHGNTVNGTVGTIAGGEANVIQSSAN